MRILLTNDDGIQAVGLRAMHKALVAAGHDVQVVA
ncbi:MAG: 5'/3'-nucleotidase SurE, partial [Desulfovibrio sp.]|nr:5'/3'-nucleotidase SurE [Desulfovibrio sp.]